SPTTPRNCCRRSATWYCCAPAAWWPTAAAPTCSPDRCCRWPSARRCGSSRAMRLRSCSMRSTPVPELPEVETTRAGLAPHVEGRRVRKVTLRRPDLRWPIPPEVVDQMPGQRIEAVRRRAKYLLLDTAAGSALL